MRDKIKFEKPEEIPLEEIKVGKDGESDSGVRLTELGCVVIMAVDS